MSRSTNDVLAAAFYTVAAGASVIGATQAAVEWSGWGWPVAAAAVGAFELGGVVLAGVADDRRAKGERALDARLLSGAIAIGAAALQWVGHDGTAAGFFPALSLAAYATYLIRSRNRRRDALRETGMLDAVPPVYGVVRWCRSPWLTRRARALAMADPSLGLHGSLAAAAEERRAEKRRAAIAKALHRKLTTGRDRVSATIAVNTYDLDRVATAIAATADYDGLAALLSADLTPTRVAHLSDTVADIVSDATPALTPAPVRHVEVVTTPPVSDTVTVTTPARGSRRVSRKPSTAEQVARLRERHPDMSVSDIAKRVGVSERTVSRHLPKRGDTSGSSATVVDNNGGDHGEETSLVLAPLTVVANQVEHVNGASASHLVPTF